MIRVGPGVIFFKGQELGLTQGGIEFEVESSTHVTNADQFGETTVAEFIEKRDVKVTAPLLEVGLDNLVRTMPGATLVTDAADPTKKRVDVKTGIGSSLLEFSGELVIRPLVNNNKTPVDKSEDVVVGLASTMGKVSFSYKHDEERIYPVEFMAYPNSITQNIFSFGDPDAGAIALTAPTQGEVVAGDTYAVTWDAQGNTDHDNYRVTAGKVAGTASYYDSGVLTSATLTDTVTGLPEDGSDVWITVYYLQNGEWLSRQALIVSNP